MPENADILFVHIQQNQPTIWAQVDLNVPMVKKTFLIFATGEDIPNRPMEYVGTVMIHEFVWHIFEVID